MKFYAVGDRVRLADDRLATVTEATKGQYELPEGQSIGGQPGATHGGEAFYTVKTDDGEELEVQDRDIYNLTREQQAAEQAAAIRKVTAPAAKKRSR